MTFDVMPSRLLSFPSLHVPSIWNDDENWLSNSSSASGLSVSEDESKIYIEASLPGIDPNKIEMTFQDGYLWVRGETQEEEKDKGKKYYRQASRSFSYRVAVPGDLDNSIDPSATYKHGIMTVAFTKSPKAQPKKIQIKPTIEEAE